MTSLDVSHKLESLPRIVTSWPPYRLRTMFAPRYYLPCRVTSDGGARHYLSGDPVDDLVLVDMLDALRGLYFPDLPPAIVEELEEGGWILDVGAYGGNWTAEMLCRYTRARAVLLEPSVERCRNILKTLSASKLGQRTHLVAAGVGSGQGAGLLVRSDEGSWGDWVSQQAEGNPGPATMVAVTSLSNVLGSIQPTVVKCNAEGGEFELVPQLFALGRKPRLIILMIHPERGDGDSLLRLVSESGYSLELAWDNPRRPCWHAWRQRDGVTDRVIRE